MAADPKWLDILKTNVWQAGAGAAAFGIFLLLVSKGVIDDPGAPFYQFIWLIFLLLSAWAFIGLAKNIFDFFDIEKILKRWLGQQASLKELREYIPYMNDEERRIIGYLLHHNQQSFMCSADGGHAATLLGRRIIVPVMVQGQQYSEGNMPVTILPYIWEELQKHRSQFPYNPLPAGKTEVHPWRVSFWAQ